MSCNSIEMVPLFSVVIQSFDIFVDSLCCVFVSSLRIYRTAMRTCNQSQLLTGILEMADGNRKPFMSCFNNVSSLRLFPVNLDYSRRIYSSHGTMALVVFAEPENANEDNSY